MRPLAPLLSVGAPLGGSQQPEPLNKEEQRMGAQKALTQHRGWVALVRLNSILSPCAHNQTRRSSGCPGPAVIGETNSNLPTRIGMLVHTGLQLQHFAGRPAAGRRLGNRI